MLESLTVADWIAILSLLLALQGTVVGMSLWVARKNAEALAAGPAAVHDHERECANFEPNTAVKIKAIRDNA